MMAFLFSVQSVDKGVLFQVHLVERIPWHEALYFVTTTLTTGNLL